MLNSISNDPNIARIWKRFSELSTIPRPSKGEGKAAVYLEACAKDLGLEVERDSENNILIKLPATKDHKSSSGIILQGHSDMVCVSDDSHDNPKTAGVKPILTEDEKWVTADGTTLGADNGIGVATFLALLEDESFEHGPLALLVTTDEETGLNGASKCDFDFSDYKYFINGDSEEWGEAVIGCAGGEDSIVTFTGSREKVETHAWFTLSVKGLAGGHSAQAIVTPGHANAIDVVNGIVMDVSKEIGIRIFSYSGGSARNVIPSDASVTFVIDDQSDDFMEVFDRVITKYKKELSAEPRAEFVFSPAGMTGEVFTREDSVRLMGVIDALPHGVYYWADDAETVPQTSTNLATISTLGDVVTVTNMSRSSVNAQIDEMSTIIADVSKNHNASIAHEGRYLGWEPIPDSDIVELTQNAYKSRFSDNLDITQTHGGLECGIILSKYPHLKAISIGPTITGAHSTNEKVEIETVEKFYHLTKEVIRLLSKEN